MCSGGGAVSPSETRRRTHFREDGHDTEGMSEVFIGAVPETHGGSDSTFFSFESRELLLAGCMSLEREIVRVRRQGRESVTLEIC